MVVGLVMVTVDNIPKEKNWQYKCVKDDNRDTPKF
jgi:hypothetical protein